MRRTWKCQLCNTVFITEEPENRRPSYMGYMIQRACPKCGSWASPYDGWMEFENIRIKFLLVILILTIITGIAFAIKYFISPH
jgi:rubredoxin